MQLYSIVQPYATGSQNDVLYLKFSVERQLLLWLVQLCSYITSVSSIWLLSVPYGSSWWPFLNHYCTFSCSGNAASGLSQAFTINLVSPPSSWTSAVLTGCGIKQLRLLSALCPCTSLHPQHSAGDHCQNCRCSQTADRVAAGTCCFFQSLH